MPLSAFDRTNIGSIIQGHGDWFTAHLLRLIDTADPINRDRLRISYPEEVGAYERWYADSNHPNRFKLPS